METAVTAEPATASLPAIAGGIAVTGLYGASIVIAISLVLAGVGGPIGQVAGTGTLAISDGLADVMALVGTLFH